MEYKVRIADRLITLVHEDVEDTIDVDSLTKIDPSNLYGEAVTIAAAMNRVGLLKAEIEEIVERKKLEIKVYESNFIGLRRKEASIGGKFKIRVGEEDVEVRVSEKALEKCYENDKGWISLKQELIELNKNFARIDSLYWSCQSKDKKLSNLTNSVTPEEFVKEMIEGKFNGIDIKL